MAGSKLKPEILQALVEITGSDKQSLWVKIAKRKAKYPVLTSNAVAYLIAQDYKRSLMGKLDEEDRASLRDYQLLHRQSSPVIVSTPRRGKANGGRVQKKPIISYVSANPANSYFVNEHIKELTDAYYAKCYTAVFILFRKIVENLIIDILRAKFPGNINLVLDTGQGRYRDFSVVLQNLYNERNAFSHDGKKVIETLYNRVSHFKKDANDKAHSWFHIVETPDEVDKESRLEPIMERIIFLEREVGLRTT
jgi:hypothetical protein